MSFKYIDRIYELLKTIETEECENIKKAVDMLYECDRLIPSKFIPYHFSILLVHSLI